MNKVSSWYVYPPYTGDSPANTRWHRFWEAVARQFWLDVLLDVATIVMFAKASWTLTTVFG